MTTIIEQLRALHDRALHDASTYVERCTSVELSVATPCVGWDLAALLRHMIGQNDGFATAVSEGDAPLSAYDGPVITPETLLPAWERSTSRLRAAFARAEPVAQVHLAEFGVAVTVEQALRMQLLDSAVHAWDVATSLGADYRPTDEVVAPVLEDAQAIAARRPGGTPGVFAAAVEVTGEPWHDALRLLGRRA